MKAALLTAFAATALALTLPTDAPASAYVRFGVQDDSFLAGTTAVEPFAPRHDVRARASVRPGG